MCVVGLFFFCFFSSFTFFTNCARFRTKALVLKWRSKRPRERTRACTPAQGAWNLWWDQTGLLGVWPVIFTGTGTSFGKWTCTSCWRDNPPLPLHTHTHTHTSPPKKGGGIEKKMGVLGGMWHEQNIDSDNIVIIKARTPGVASVILEHCDSWWNI